MPLKPLARTNSVDSDPLALAIRPDIDESPEQRLLRENDYALACKISEQIDEQIALDRLALKKWQKAVKILLLGQSESGKSTTIKNFQMKYAYDAWVKERNSWKTVILLNLVKSVTIILDLLEKEISHPTWSKKPSSVDSTHPGLEIHEGYVPSLPRNLMQNHTDLISRLQPLFQVKRDLEHYLGSASIDDYIQSPPSTGPGEPRTASYPSRLAEFSITTQRGWKMTLGRLRSQTHDQVAKNDDTAEALKIVVGCGSDIKKLWADDVVQAFLTRLDVRLEHDSGFFLNDVDRILAPDYEPSDDDVVRARLRTMGVQEYHFSPGNSPGTGRDWILYDVGGARSSRAAWYPYFEEVTSIIFLAPISCFDQRLAENLTVNRLEDSLQLWKAICSSPILAAVQMILFLNKIDLLEEKLKTVMFNKHVLNYGARPNDVSSVSKYLQNQFRAVFNQASPNPRVFYSFLTSVIDTKAMSSTLGAVFDGILRNAFVEADFL